jgi:hypothetical protein
MLSVRPWHDQCLVFEDDGDDADARDSGLLRRGNEAGGGGEALACATLSFSHASNSVAVKALTSNSIV